MSEGQGERRLLGTFDATMVVAGAIVGVGIFALPEQVAQRLPDARWAVFAWVVGGVIATLGALTFARLASLVPKAGGTYAFLREAFGPFPSFLYGWASMLTINAGAMAFMANMFAMNVGFLVGIEDSSDWQGRLIAAGAIVLLSIINAIGVKQGSVTQNVMTVAKLLAIVALLIAGFVVTPEAASANATAKPEPIESITFQAFCFGLLPVLFSYGGWQNACNLAEQVRDPRRSVARAVIIGTTLAALVYVGYNWALFRQLGVEGVADPKTPLGRDTISGVMFGGAALGAIGGKVVTVVIAVSAFGVLNGFILGTPWIVYAMSRDGAFLPALAKLHERARIPLRVIVLQAVFALVYVFSATLVQIVDGLVVIDWLFFGLAGCACWKLSRRATGDERSRGAKIAVLFAALSLFVVATVVWASLASDKHQAKMALVQLGVLGVGAVVYAVVYAVSRPKRITP